MQTATEIDPAASRKILFSSQQLSASWGCSHMTEVTLYEGGNATTEYVLKSS
jgi:hypothetical protein